jgi:dTMP kinase
MTADPVDCEGTGTPPPPSPGVYRRVLKNRSFRRLWLAQAVSGIGDWLVIGLLLPLVTQLSGGSSFAVAGILIAKIIPSLFFSSLIGVLVDRFDRRRVMIAADVTRAVLVLGLVFTSNLAVIYLTVLVMEVASLFFYPAKNAVIPTLVDEEDVAAANGLSYTTQQASMLVGLTASGAILALFERVVRAVIAADPPLLGELLGVIAPELLGPRAGVFLDSTTFLVSALLIVFIRLPKADGDRVKLDLHLFGQDLVESYRFLRDHTELKGLLVTIGLAILGGGAIIPVGVIYVQQNLTGTVPFLDAVPVLEKLIAAPQTFMLVFMAVGMVSGALVVPRLAGRLNLQFLFMGGVAGFGLSMLGFASSDLYWVASLFGVGAGFFIAEVTVAGNTYIAETVCDELRGRVFTATESVIRVALLLSMIVTAPFGDLLGRIIYWIVEFRDILPETVTVTGSRLTLIFASLLVLVAAYYGYRTLDWRGRNGKAADETGATDGEADHTVEPWSQPDEDDWAADV